MKAKILMLILGLMLGTATVKTLMHNVTGIAGRTWELLSLRTPLSYQVLFIAAHAVHTGYG